MKSYKQFKKKYKEHYIDIKEEWEEFERKFWEKYPQKKYCHACGEKKNVELHHIIPRHVNPDKIFDENNLIPLCRCCHFRIGHLCNWEKYNVDVVKDAEYMLNLINLRKKFFEVIRIDK